MSDVDYTITDWVIADAKGEILLTGSTARYQIEAQVLQPGQQLVEEKADLMSDYVAASHVAPRPANTSTLAAMKISNVPNPSTVTIDGGDPVTVTDGEVDLEFDQPATYTVVVSSWPMLDATFEVTQS